MDEPNYRYVMELRTEEGAMIGQAHVRPDFEPLLECARFQALRNHGGKPDDYDRAVRIEPVWHASLGEPYVGGVHCEVIDMPGVSGSVESAVTYFKTLAQRVGTVFVERGALEKGDSYVYFVSAFPDGSREPATNDRNRFSVARVATRVPLMPGCLKSLSGVASALASPDSHSDDMPVFIPQRVLDQVCEATRSSDEKETGGVLIGYLHRDTESGEVFVEVTEQIPARLAEGELTRLSFTPESWKDLGAVIALRGKGETYTGWWHSHPVKHWNCKECPPERQKTCELARGFFSQHDRALHRTAFPRAWNISLVASDTPVSGITFRLFGWRGGQIESRSFSIIRGVKGSAIVGGKQ